MKTFFTELKRRNVFKVGIAYAVVAWVIAQVIDLAADNFAVPEWFTKMVLILLVLGLPVALVLSWAYELTPEGVKKTEKVDKKKSITPLTGKKINKIIIGFLGLAVVFLLADKFWFADDPTGTGQASIAVLPFLNLSADASNEYFADGLSEELLSLLAKFPDLKVAGRTSSFQFKGRNLDLRKIGQTLNVAHILEGSVRKQDNRVRITAQLIRASDGFHLWAETYDRNLKDIFQVQEEIAKAIAGALEIQFGTGKRGLKVQAPTNSREAHEEYLKGRFYWNKRGIENLHIAKNHYEKAIELDPDYALAHLGMAETLVLIPDYNPVMVDQREVYLESERYARKTLELDPSLGQAHTTLGYVLFELDRWGEAIEEMQKSVELVPDYATGWQWLGNRVLMAGNLKESERMLAKARELDPLSPIIVSNYIDVLFANGKIDQTEQELKAALKLFPDFPLVHLTRGYLELLKENWEKARDGFTKYTVFLEGNPDIINSWVDLIEIYKNTGQPAQVPPELLDTVKNLDFYSSSPDFIYLAGHPDLAFQELQALLKLTGPRYLVFYSIWFPSYAPLRQDPRFKAVMRESGFVDLWKTYGWPDKCRPIGDNDFECK